MEEGGGLTQGKEGAMVARVWQRGGARPGWRRRLASVGGRRLEDARLSWAGKAS
jgi:hypothetical protein